MDRPLVPVVWHYFNFSDESANKVKIYQTLARELFRKLPADDDDEISDQVYTIAKKERCSTESLQNFVRAITAEFDTTFIFLDGLDEAYTDGSRRIAMLDVLHFCQQLATKPDGNVKLWCSSQKREKIEEKLKQFPSIHLTADKNAEDMSMLFKEAQRPGALNDISEAYRRLALILLKTKVKGNMLWAKLMMKSIEKAHDDEDIKKLIENIDDGCAGDFGKYLSKRIQDIEGSDLKVVWYESSSFVWFCRDRLRRFSQILSCLVYAKRDLRSDELCEAIAIFKTGKGKNISDSRIFTGKIVDWCAPLVRKSEHLQTTTYTVSHASVRQYLLSNPDVLQGKDLKEDLRISSEFMAFACLKYLQQPRYKHELKPKMGDQDIETFLTWDGQNTIVHHFLTYSAKYWAGHIEDFLKDRTDRQKVCDEVELFLKSNQFITCLQVQSLWVEGKFSFWYGSGVREKGRQLVRAFPRQLTNHKDCDINNHGPTPCLRLLEMHYREAIGEWGYLLDSALSARGSLSGQIDKCLWGSLGKHNFLYKVESHAKSYRIEKSETWRQPSCGFRYFDTVIRRGDGISVILLQLRCVDRILLDFEFRRWKMEAGHRPRAESPENVPVSFEQLKLYDEPLQTQIPGRPVAAMAFNDGRILRIGSKLYARQDSGRFKELDFEADEVKFLEEMDSNSSLLAIASRRQIDESDLQQVRPQFNMLYLDPGSACATDDEYDGSTSAMSSDKSSNVMSDSDSDTSSEISDFEDKDDGHGNDDTLDTADVIPEIKLEAKDEAYPLEDSTDFELEHPQSELDECSARESYSEASTSDQGDGIDDERAWSEFYSSDDLEFGDLEQSISLSDPLSIRSSEKDEDEDANPFDFLLKSSGSSTKSPSSISVKSNVSGFFDTDSDAEHEYLIDGFEAQGKSKRDALQRVSKSKQLCQLSIFDTSHTTDPLRHIFKFFCPQAGLLFNSPPVFHPSGRLLVWPIGRDELLFANFADSEHGNTYFRRCFGYADRNTCHVSVQVKFSDNGQFLHLACVDGQFHTNSAADRNLEGLRMSVFTYRFSKGKLARSPPKLIQRASTPLCMPADFDGKIPVSPLPYTFTWTEKHVYATQSSRQLRIFRVPLFQWVEKEEYSSQEDAEQPDGLELNDTPDEVAFMNCSSRLFLPESAQRRPIHFFPLLAPKLPKEESKKPSKSQGSPIVATLVLSSESVKIVVDAKNASKTTGAHRPPQVVYLTAGDVGKWVRVSKEVVSSQSATEEKKRCWRGGKLLAKCEKFDRYNDCQIEPYVW